MKQTLAFIIAVMMLAGVFTASAAEPPLLTIDEYNIDQAYVVLGMECGSEYSGVGAVLRVFDTGKAQTLENLVWADETRVSETGKVSFKVNMESFDSAVYKFTVDVKNIYTTVSKELTFYSVNEKEILWNSIQTAKSNNDTAAIKQIIESRSEYLNLDKEAYDALEEKEQNFLTNLLSCSFSSIDEFVKKFDINLDMTGFIGASDSAAKLLTDDIIKRLNMEKTPAAEAYAKSETLRKIVTEEMIKNAASITSDNFKEKFDTVIILRELKENLDLSSAYEKILRHYKSEIGIDFSEYDELENQASILNSMTDKTDDFVTLSDIAETFKKLVQKPESEGNININLGNDRNNDGGGGGGGNVVKAPQTQLPETVKKVSFNDISGVSWAYKAIDYLVERGVVNGRSEGVFAPNEFITRAEAVKLIVTAFNITSSNTENVFSDVKSDSWYHTYVTTAYQNGLINGVYGNTFAPDVPITRQDFAVMMSRLIKNKNQNLQLNFSDNSQIASYAKDAVALLVERGVINGTDDNRFAPLDNTTRAQAAKILFEMIRTGV